MLVINLFGAPGSGKSTLALLVAGFLKTRWPRFTVECPNEVAKMLVYDESLKALGCDIYIAGNQYWQVARCAGHADIVVCDSPILMSPVYASESANPMPTEYNVVCKALHDRYVSLNYFIHRNHAFETRARVHDEIEANRLSDKIEDQLYRHGVQYINTHSTELNALKIAHSAALYTEKLKQKNG
jgi:nicotinamide riboside kinase